MFDPSSSSQVWHEGQRDQPKDWKGAFGLRTQVSCEGTQPKRDASSRCLDLAGPISRPAWRLKPSVADANDSQLKKGEPARKSPRAVIVVLAAGSQDFNLHFVLTVDAHALATSVRKCRYDEARLGMPAPKFLATSNLVLWQQTCHSATGR